MDSQEFGAWLRRQREARCWARSEMARRLIKAAHASGDRSITDVDNLCHNIYRWERGMVCPGERYKFYYCRVFGISASEFGVGKAEVEISDANLAMTVLYSLAGVLGLWRELSGETLVIRRRNREEVSPDNQG
jgi:hypothetical protein